MSVFSTNKEGYDESILSYIDSKTIRKRQEEIDRGKEEKREGKIERKGEGKID
jgi:hypothetical protein